jgi:5'-nucleotidase
MAAQLITTKFLFFFRHTAAVAKAGVRVYIFVVGFHGILKSKNKNMSQSKNLCLLVAVLLSSFLSVTASAQNYRILLSNDDGVDSPLLHALYNALVALPDTEVLVSAPADNQSGSSQSSGVSPLRVSRYELEGEFIGYAVAGRPADAVRFAVVEFGREQPFDLVVSGINRGANVGDVSHLSGTVGAAMEGLYHGIPAIAVSEDTSGVDTRASAQFAASLVRHYQQQGALEGIVLSVNIPRGELQGVVVRPMGDSYLYTSDYELIEDNGDERVYERVRDIVPSNDQSSDTWAWQQGYITLTPLQFDWTAHQLIDEIESWSLSLPD